MKVTSCGVLVFSRERRLLLGHATGTRRWDIPKGVGEPGEPPRATAVREAAEETGLRLDAPSLLELGVFAYLPAKSLHLFAAMIDEVGAAELFCTSSFRDAHGRLRPELDRHRWVPLDEVPRLCAAGMARVLTASVDLPAVHDRLLACARRRAA